MVDMDDGDEDTQSLHKLIDVNSLIHNPVRLSILLFLLPRNRATFPEVKDALDLTSGNLSSHMQKLEDADLILVEKAFIDSKPTTILSVTNLAMKAISEYANVLRSTLEIIEKPGHGQE